MRMLMTGFIGSTHLHTKLGWWPTVAIAEGRCRNAEWYLDNERCWFARKGLTAAGFRQEMTS